MNSIFKGLKDRFVDVKIGEDIVRVRPLVSDAEAFITLKKEMDSIDVKTISKIIVDMICRANREEEREDIEAYVATHYGDLLMKVAVVFGFATDAKIEEAKKKMMPLE